MPVINKGDKVHVEFDAVAITSPTHGLIYVTITPKGNVEWTMVPQECVTLLKES